MCTGDSPASNEENISTSTTAPPRTATEAKGAAGAEAGGGVYELVCHVHSSSSKPVCADWSNVVVVAVVLVVAVIGGVEGAFPAGLCL